MMRNRRRLQRDEAELDITAFMNLMIVLVPVLLLSLVFSQVSAIEISLPQLGEGSEEAIDQRQVELLIRVDRMQVNYPRGIMLKRIPRGEDGDFDYAVLSLVLQEVKRQLAEQGLERRGITILAEEAIDYQTIVTAMDTVRSFEALVAANVVDAALFPEISFADAPPRDAVRSDT
ncbi:MAG: biopolymer transporter ExbD [Pseudomonadota bacterium]